MNCQIRIDGAWEDISIWFTENLADLFEYIAVYEHPAKTTKGVHIHALCMSCRRSMIQSETSSSVHPMR